MRKKASQGSPVVPQEERVIRSSRVREDVERYYSIRLPKNYTQADYDAAYAELNVFRKDYYGDENLPEMEVIVNGMGLQVLRFPVSMSFSGMRWNPETYPNAVDVETLL